MAWLFHKHCALCCDQLLHSGAYEPICSFVPSCHICILVVSHPQEQHRFLSIKKKCNKGML